ncbi:MAG: UDP-N-acetyl-D-galactosamine dehydrogenase [Psychroserpens sp.]|jgi:UDP-N-acetyl-D-galactosamine dehydrogenase
MKTLENSKIGIIGLGYVGLPLAVEFGKKFPLVGFDVNKKRINELKRGIDHTLETDNNELVNSKVIFTDVDTVLVDCNVFIITVPTPIDQFNKPDLDYLYKASKIVGKFLKPGDVVVYESTVYPGCTEEDCVPILEKVSELEYNKDFYCGYSPERINPGDKERTLTKILKIVAGSNQSITEFLAELYGSIITAGIYKASCIKVAEAAKAIENAQRDINISFVNELALIFDRMNIDTTEVLEAAGTKWNFLPFKPGLVGGHCIGVDPYYLVYKAQSLGYTPQVISSGRIVNDGMGAFVAKKLIKALITNKQILQNCRILILGITFKENCPDIRNTKVIDVYKELKDFGLQVDIFDPWASKEEVLREFAIEILEAPLINGYDGIILAVSHTQFIELSVESLKRNENAVIFDIKSIYEKKRVDMRL